jgi:hypothetical protein
MRGGSFRERSPYGSKRNVDEHTQPGRSRPGVLYLSGRGRRVHELEVERSYCNSYKPTRFVANRSGFPSELPFGGRMGLLIAAPVPFWQNELSVVGQFGYCSGVKPLHQTDHSMKSLQQTQDGGDAGAQTVDNTDQVREGSSSWWRSGVGRLSFAYGAGRRLRSAGVRCLGLSLMPGANGRILQD